MGGALTPFVVIPVMAWVGWRSAFYLLGALGIVWAVVWYGYYRDRGERLQVGELCSEMRSEVSGEKLRFTRLLANTQF